MWLGYTETMDNFDAKRFYVKKLDLLETIMAALADADSAFYDLRTNERTAPAGDVPEIQEFHAKLMALQESLEQYHDAVEELT